MRLGLGPPVLLLIRLELRHHGGNVIVMVVDRGDSRGERYVWEA